MLGITDSINELIRPVFILEMVFPRKLIVSVLFFDIFPIEKD